MHMEIESQGQVQFAAYDSFTHVFFSDGIDASFLETCLAQGMITKYRVY
jgi:hypothetical protein